MAESWIDSAEITEGLGGRGDGTTTTVSGASYKTGSAFPGSPDSNDLFEFNSDATGLTGAVDYDGSTSVTTASRGDVFKYNGSNWVKQSASGVGGGTSYATGTSFPASPSNGDLFEFNADATGLSGVVDFDGSTALTTASRGDVFKYNGTNWVKQSETGTGTGLDSVSTDSTIDGDGTSGSPLNIADDAVTLAKLAGGTAGKVIGFDASGDPAELDSGTGSTGVTVPAHASGTTYSFGAIVRDSDDGLWMARRETSVDPVEGEDWTKVDGAIDVTGLGLPALNENNYDNIFIDFDTPRMWIGRREPTAATPASGTSGTFTNSNYRGEHGTGPSNPVTNQRYYNNSDHHWHRAYNNAWSTVAFSDAWDSTYHWLGERPNDADAVQHITNFNSAHHYLYYRTSDGDVREFNNGTYSAPVDAGYSYHGQPISAPSGVGTQVDANPSGTDGTGLTRISIAGANYNITVPDEITKVDMSDVTYNTSDSSDLHSTRLTAPALTVNLDIDGTADAEIDDLFVFQFRQDLSGLPTAREIGVRVNSSTALPIRIIDRSTNTLVNMTVNDTARYAFLLLSRQDSVFLALGYSRILINTAQLVDDAVTLAKMASGTAGEYIGYDASGNPASLAAPSTTVTSDSTLSGDGSSGTPLGVADDGITQAKIADDAVGTDQVADDAIAQAQIADDAVGTDQVADDAITQAQVADDAIGTDQIADDAVTQDKVADNAIGLDQLASGTAEKYIGYDASGNPTELDSGAELHAIAGLPNPSASQENQVVVNSLDHREYICVNEPEISGASTGTLVDLSTYYTTDDADLRVAHSLPTATSTDDDKWIYIDSGIDKDKFYFGDTAPGSSYAWYEDSPADALREVCLAYVENVASTSLTNLGASASVVYLGQHQDDADIRSAIHNITPVFTANYYVAWHIQEEVFKIIEDDYSAPGTVTNHYKWRNVRAEALNPILRPHIDGSFPAATLELFEEKAILVDWAGHNWFIRHIERVDATARGTWTGYGPGDTVPGLHSTDTYRGVVDNTGQVTSPGNRDVCVVRTGSTARLKLYLSAGGGGWYDYTHPDNFDRLLGVFNSLGDADGHVGHFNSGDGVYAVVGYRLYRLTAFTAGTTSHIYNWESSIQQGNPVAIFYGLNQNERFPANYPITGLDDDISIIPFGDPTADQSSGATREYYNGGELFESMWVATADIPSDADTVDGNTPNAYSYFKPPAGLYNIRVAVAIVTGTDQASMSLRKVTAGTDDIVIPSFDSGSGEAATLLDATNVALDGTEVLWVRSFENGPNNGRAFLEIEKVG